MQKKLLGITFLASIFTQSVSASFLDDIIIGGGLLNSNTHKQSSGTLSYNDTKRNNNLIGKIGINNGDERVYLQVGTLYSSDTFDVSYSSNTVNYEIDLANKYGWKPFAGVHIGVGVSEMTDSNGVERTNYGLEFGGQIGLRKNIHKYVELEGGWRYTKQSAEITTTTGNLYNKYTNALYSNMNITF
jgi:hypothetical protein